MEPVFILIRTSNRPKFFARMMETIKNQTYENIVTIIHSDDPRDEYITGDIILRYPAYGLEYGNGSYNLYMNRLLRAIPENEGWFHFMDDDDEYATPEVIERLVNASLKDHINVGRVMRWNGTIWPKKWGHQDSFQTECFFLQPKYKFAGKARWWGNKGGDHNYSKKLTKVLPINWIDNLLICKAQEGKGHGRKLDKGGKRPDYTNYKKPDEKIPVLGLLRNTTGRKEERIRQGEMKWMKYGIALKLEEEGIVKITNWGTYREAPQAKLFINM